MKKEIEDFRRKLKQAQKDMYRAWEIARAAPLTRSVHSSLEQKQRHFRSMKKRLAEMEENLKVLQEGNEIVRVEPWKVSRPANESKLIMFCEA